MAAIRSDLAASPFFVWGADGIRIRKIEFWGIDKSFAFVAEPQTNGVAERFNRTLKEQAIRKAA